MASDDDDKRLLDLLEPKADPTLAAGFKWGKLSDAGIFGFVGREQIVARGKKPVNIYAADNARMAIAIGALRWPVLDRYSPLATDIWAERALACQQFQESLRLASPAQTVAAEDDDGLIDQIIVRPMQVRL